jgi:hypothetical protein
VSILSDFEDRVSGAIEGVFAGVFRSPVQPAELARASAKEMDRRKKLGVGKVYAPTLYSVLLSPVDGEQLAGFADTLAGELSTYLRSYANERDYVLSTKPVVRFLIDDELKLGRFVVIGELLSPEEIAAEVGEQPAGAASEAGLGMPSPPPAEKPVSVPRAPVAEPIDVPAFFDAEAHIHDEMSPASAVATLTVPGMDSDIVLRGERLVIGRLKTCDVCLGDANASRQHAALEREGAGWALVDLGSTNGTLVNDEPADRVRLRDGDAITIGVSRLAYHEPRG